MSLDNGTHDQFGDVTTVDVRRKKKIFVTIQDSDGDEVDMKDMLDNLNRYITDNLVNEDANVLKDEISPLITQIFMGSLVYASGHPGTAAFIASQESMRYTITHQMLLSFYFLKFVQKNNLKIITREEDVSDEEIEKIRRINKANSVATMGAMMGVEPKDIIKQLIKSGQLNKEDVSQAFMDGIDDDSEEEVSEDKDGNKITKPDPNSN